MQPILNFLSSIIGDPPDYFTVGAGNTPQWHYGNLMEYFFAGLLVVLCVSYIFKIFLSFFKK